MEKVKRREIMEFPKFDMDRAVERALSKEGLWLRTRDGDLFVLFMRKCETRLEREGDVEPFDEKLVETVRLDLYFAPEGEGTKLQELRYVGYSDRDILFYVNGSVEAASIFSSPPTLFNDEDPVIREGNIVREAEGFAFASVLHPFDENFSGIYDFLISFQDLYSVKRGAMAVFYLLGYMDEDRIYGRYEDMKAVIMVPNQDGEAEFFLDENKLRICEITRS